MKHERAFIVCGITAVAAAVLPVGTDAAAAGALDALKTRGSITLCADANFLPHSSKAMDPPGFDVEVAQEVARDLGLRLDYQWILAFKGHRAIRNLYDGDCDFFMGLPNDENFLDEYFKIDVTVPYYIGGFAILAKRGHDDVDLDAYKASGVGVQMGTVPDFRLFDQGFERKLYRDVEEVADAMQHAKLEVAVVPALEAAWLAHTKKELGLQVLQHTKAQFIYPMGFGVRKKEKDLKAAINAAIGKLDKSGRLGELRDKYGLPQLVSDGGAAPPSVTQAVSKSGGGEAKVSAVESAAASDTASAIAAEFPSDAKSIEKGRKLYKQACYKCHGPNGVSGGTVPDLRKFNGDHFEMLAIIQGGRVELGMPAWHDYLTPEEIKEIVVYVKSLPKE